MTAHFHDRFSLDTSKLCHGNKRTPRFCAYKLLVLEAPGPDGFPAEFYKHFVLFPLFIRAIAEIKQN